MKNHLLTYFLKRVFGMFKKAISRLAILLLSVSTVAVAGPFSVTWTDTLASSDLPYIVGEPVSITYMLDNGGSSAASQTWTATDVASVTFVFNNAPNTITTIFDPNSGSGLAGTSGSFITDGTGTLTSAPSDWNGSDGASPIVSSNDPQGTSNVRWWVNGNNEVYVNESVPLDEVSASAANVLTNTDPAAWSDPVAVAAPPPAPPPPPASATPVPTISAYGLVLTILGLLIVAGRRLRASAKRS
jgi:hypothetical protein